MLIRESIQNLALICTAVLFGVSVAFIESSYAAAVASGYLAASFGLAGIWVHNDLLEIRMGRFLQSLEDDLGFGWERWVKSPDARFSGPIRSGHLITTRGLFVVSQIVMLIVALIFADSHLLRVLDVSLFAATIFILIPSHLTSTESPD